MKNILCIIDNNLDRRRFLKYAEKIKGTDCLNFYICPITVNSDFIHQIKKDLSGHGKAEILPFIKEFHKNAFLYKERFIKFLSDFSSGKIKDSISLRKYFKYPFGDFSLWWLSLVQEKNTLKEESYHNLAKLITIFDFRRDYCIERIYVDIENKILKKAIFRNRKGKEVYVKGKFRNNIIIDLAISWLKAIGYSLYFIIRKCVVHFINRADIKRRMSKLKETEFLLVTYFPCADKEGLKERVFKNKFFGPLQDSIEKRFKDKVSWIGITAGNTRLNTDKMKLTRRINTWGNSLFLLEELISIRNILGSIITFLYISLKFLGKLPYISYHFVFGYGRKINIWDLFEKEWIYSFFGNYLIGSLFYYHAFANVMSRIKDGAIIIYPSEMQNWENALNIARKRNKNIKTIGIQHAALALLLLNYFNAPDDFKENDSIEAFPVPGYLATSGGIPKQLLIEGGWPKEKLFDIGALRYHRLSKFLEKEIDWNVRKKQVVVALSVAEIEAREILLMLWQIFRNENICAFIIKPHPQCPIGDIANSIGFEFIDNKFTLETERPLEDLLISSRAVIVAGSSASMDSIACQCPVIIPKLSCVADMNPLSGINEKLSRYVTNGDEFIDATRTIVNSEESPIGFDECRSFINNYFTLIDNEDEYFMRLEKKISNK